MNNLFENFHFKFVWFLPKKLVYFCLIRAWVYGTTGIHSNTDANLVTMNEIARRWAKK